MTRTITLAGLAFAAVTSLTATFALTQPAAAADPVCVAGFSTVQKTGWLLKCRKIVPLSQKGVVLTQANNANCNTNSYWNYGPAVTGRTMKFGKKFIATYVCGHVEG